jgi:O-Antigen ligase
LYGSAPQDRGNRISNAPIPAVLLEQVPPAVDFLEARQRLNRQFVIAAILSALISGGAFIFMELDSAALPLVLATAVLTPVLMWRYPMLLLYIVLTSTCLFEIFDTNHSDSITDKVPFFWNVNTIFQSRGANVKAVPLNIFEVLVVTAGLCSGIQAILGRRVSLQGSILLRPMVAYLAFVFLNIGRGLAEGNDYHIIMQEVRAQVYFLLSFLIAINLIKKSQHFTAILWISAATIALKGVLYTFRRYVTMAGLPLPDQGVGSHEEAFFFNCYVTLLITLWLCRSHLKLQLFMLMFLPTVIMGNLATNRRAGTAALVVAVPILILAAYRALPARRKMAAALGITLLIAGPTYYNAFKNSESAIAQPARAIRSHFQPDERDLNSNQYRDAENLNLISTIKESPYTTVMGYGYGKKMLHVAEIADISDVYELWDILPHNQILWIWMRTGTLGFIAFWGTITAIIIRLCRIILLNDKDGDTTHKIFGIWGITILAMLMIFGLLDLQLSIYRNMIFVPIIFGAAEVLRSKIKSKTTSMKH